MEASLMPTLGNTMWKTVTRGRSEAVGERLALCAHCLETCSPEQHGDRQRQWGIRMVCKSGVLIPITTRCSPRTYVCTHVHRYTHTYTHKYTFTHIHTYTHSHILTDTYTHTDTHSHIQIHINTHTHSIYTTLNITIPLCLHLTQPRVCCTDLDGNIKR